VCAQDLFLACVLSGPAVEAALANRDGERSYVAGRSDDLRDEVTDLGIHKLRHDLRMHAECDAQQRTRATELDEGWPRARPDRRDEDAGHARALGSRYDVRPVAIEALDVEVTVRVDQRVECTRWLANTFTQTTRARAREASHNSRCTNMWISQARAT
jgi:hypothetical protein